MTTNAEPKAAFMPDGCSHMLSAAELLTSCALLLGVLVFIVITVLNSVQA